MVAILVVILCAVFKTCMRKRDSAGTIMGPPPEQPIGGGGFYGGGGAYPTQPGFNPGFAHPGMEPRLYQGYSPGKRLKQTAQFCKCRLKWKTYFKLCVSRDKCFTADTVVVLIL